MDKKTEQITNQSNRTIGATLSMANMVASLVIGLLYTPFVLRTLGQGEYGVYSLANSLIAYLSILDLGLGKTLVRYVSRANAEGKDEKYINGMFLVFYSLIALIALTIGLVLSFNLEAFFSTSFTTQEIEILQRIFYVLLVNIVIAFPATVFSSIISSREKFIFSGIVTLVSNIVRHATVCVFLYFGYRSLSMAVISLSTTVIVLLINLYYCFKKLHVKIGFKRFEASFYKEVFFYSFFILVNLIVDRLYSSTDNIILGKICGSAAVSIYGIGVVFQDYFVQLSISVSGVFFPHISKLSTKKDGIKEMSNLFVRVGHIQLVLLSYILVGFAAYGANFIKLWAGEGYEESYIIALLVMIPAIIPLSQNIGISVLQALNRHKTRSLMYLCIAIINIVLSIPLAYFYQGVGAALGTALGNLLGQIMFMNWYYYKRVGLDVPKYWKQFIVILIKEIPVLILFLLANLLPGDGWTGLIIKIAVPQLIVLPYYYFVILNTEEKQMAGKVIQKARRILHV